VSFVVQWTLGWTAFAALLPILLGGRSPPRSAARRSSD
jgi:hypothetical protein